MDGYSIEQALKGWIQKVLLVGISALILIGVFVGWGLWGGS